MKRVIGLVMLVVILASSCGPKPAYKTREGKRKLKYYNSIQYHIAPVRE